MGTGGFLHGTHEKVPVALSSLHRHPQICMAPLLSDAAAQLPREPCQVRGVGNIYFLYSSSTLCKGKDGVCVPGAAWREPRGSRAGAGVGRFRTACTPASRKSQHPLRSLAWESKAIWQALRKACRSCRRAGVKPPGSSWLPPAPKRQWWWWRWWYSRYHSGFPVAPPRARGSACIHMPSASSCLFAHTRPQHLQGDRYVINCKAAY